MQSSALGGILGYSGPPSALDDPNQPYPYDPANFRAPPYPPIPNPPDAQYDPRRRYPEDYVEPGGAIPTQPQTYEPAAPMEGYPPVPPTTPAALGGAIARTYRPPLDVDEAYALGHPPSVDPGYIPGGMTPPMGRGPGATAAIPPPGAPTADNQSPAESQAAATAPIPTPGGTAQAHHLPSTEDEAAPHDFTKGNIPPQKPTPPPQSVTVSSEPNQKLQGTKGARGGVPVNAVGANEELPPVVEKPMLSPGPTVKVFKENPVLYKTILQVARDVGVPPMQLTNMVGANSDFNENFAKSGRFGLTGITEDDVAKYDPQGLTGAPMTSQQMYGGDQPAGGIGRVPHIMDPVTNLYLGALKLRDMNTEYGQGTAGAILATEFGTDRINALSRQSIDEQKKDETVLAYLHKFQHGGLNEGALQEAAGKAPFPPIPSTAGITPEALAAKPVIGTPATSQQMYGSGSAPPIPAPPVAAPAGPNPSPAPAAPAAPAGAAPTVPAAAPGAPAGPAAPSTPPAAGAPPATPASAAGPAPTPTTPAPPPIPPVPTAAPPVPSEADALNRQELTRVTAGPQPEAQALPSNPTPTAGTGPSSVGQAHPQITNQGTMTPMGLFRAGQSGPNTMLSYMVNHGPTGMGVTDMWRKAEATLANAFISRGDIAGAEHARDYIFQQAHAGSNMALMNAYRLMQAGDSVGAAKMVAQSYTFFPDGGQVTVGVTKNGQVWGQRYVEDTGEPNGQAFEITPQKIAGMLNITADPMQFMKILIEEQNANANQAYKYGLMNYKYDSLDQRNSLFSIAEEGRNNRALLGALERYAASGGRNPPGTMTDQQLQAENNKYFPATDISGQQIQPTPDEGRESDLFNQLLRNNPGMSGAMAKDISDGAIISGRYGVSADAQLGRAYIVDKQTGAVKGWVPLSGLMRLVPGGAAQGAASQPPGTQPPGAQSPIGTGPRYYGPPPASGNAPVAPPVAGAPSPYQPPPFAAPPPGTPPTVQTALPNQT